MNEFDFIYQIFAKAQANQQGQTQANTLANIIQGIGDDAAVILPKADGQQVICTDTLVQGRHFSGDWQIIETLSFAIGYKAVAVNLSDLAAMGATPHSIVLALALPERLANQRWVLEFANGLFHACNQFGMALIGGDMTKSHELMITVTAYGIIPQGYSAIYRHGARLGDKVYVSGTLGDASYALKHAHSDIGQKLSHRLHIPTPRVALGQALLGMATSMIDISDGLYQDLSHVCLQSRVAMRIDLDKLPMSNAMQEAPLQSHLVYQLTGGDDYELAFTLPADVLPPEGLGKITCIGEVVAQAEHRPYLYYQGQQVTEQMPFPFDYLPDLKGYQHF